MKLDALTESQIESIVDAIGVSKEDENRDTVVEGLGDFFRNRKLKKYRSKFLQKGNETVYFAYSDESRSFGKAVFDGNKLVDSHRYTTLSEMEEDIALMEADGYKTVKEAGKVKRFLKFVVRNLGRVTMAGSIVQFLIGTMLGLMLILSGSAAAGLLGIGAYAVGGTVSFAVGWLMADLTKRTDVLDRDHKGASEEMGQKLTESLVSSDKEETAESIRELVRATIKSHTK